MYSAYWQCILHYNSPACFSCSIVSFEGSGFFSCVSVFFNFDLSNFSISAISGFVRHGCRERGANCERVKSGLRCGRRRVPSGARRAQLYARSYANGVTSSARPLNSLAPGFVSGTASGACMAFGGAPRPPMHQATTRAAK